MSFDKPYDEILIGGILKDPGCSVVNKTGGWRSFRPIIDDEKCVGCKRCWMLCPDGIIYPRDESMMIDYDYCKGCGICANECPSGAIEMVPEVE